MTQVPYDQLPRKERLLIWLRYHGLTYKAIADAIGSKKSTVAMWCAAETIPILRRKRLEAFGIPGDLLPPGVYRRPGRQMQKCILALPPAAADARSLSGSTEANR